MDIKNWQIKVDNWIKKYGVRYFNVTTNTLLLNEEVGEFSRLIARTYGEQSFKEKLSDDEVKEKIAEELGDIIFVLTCLANQMNIDVTTVLQKNMVKKTLRDKTRHLNNPKL